jgi:hypothetical protein
MKQVLATATTEASCVLKRTPSSFKYKKNCFFFYAGTWILDSVPDSATQLIPD